MTDQEFLSADANALLQTMTLDEFNARHDAIDVSRISQFADEAEEFFVWLEGVQQTAATGRRRCLECWATLPPKDRRCSECGEPLQVVGHFQELANVGT